MPPVFSADDPPTPVLDQEVRAGTHMFLGLCVLLVVAFGTWSYVAELDVVSNATGSVAPSSNVKSVQHLEGGIIHRILIKEGAVVSQGQPLIELETTASVADVEELSVRLNALKLDIALYEAEIEGAEKLAIANDARSAHPELVAKVTGMFETRRRRMLNQVRAQNEAIRQREHEIREVRARKVNAQRNLKLVEEQIQISEKLLQQDLTNRMLHLNYLKERADLRGRIDEASATLPRLQAAAEEARSNLHIVRASFREEAQQKLDEASRSYDELSQRLKKYADSLKRTVLRAPVNGIIKTLYVSTKGGVVQPGRTVLDIVPGGDRLVIEAQLPTQDIGYVQPGQAVKVKLASADAARFADLPGEVVTVSPDTLVTEQGVPYYKVRISTKRDYFEDGTLRYSLFPGMQVICAIQTGSRTVFQYIMEPLLGRMGDALKER